MRRCRHPSREQAGHQDHLNCKLLFEDRAYSNISVLSQGEERGREGEEREGDEGEREGGQERKRDGER